MQVEEESPKQYVDIATTPDKEMRPERPVPPGLWPGRCLIAPSRAGCGQDGQLLRCPPRQYRHIAIVGRLASGPSWPQRIARLYMK
jgi:hypothetical protein